MITLDHVFRSLDTLANVFSEHILTSNYCRVGTTLSWDKYKAGISNNLLYSQEYEILLNDRQYSILMKDKSFFQFYYDFTGGGLKKAKLCYYPYPISSQEDSERLEEYYLESGTERLELYYDSLLKLFEAGVRATNNSHIRLDYDSGVESHDKSHVQYSGINDFRIPFSKVIDPLLFFEFIHMNSNCDKKIKQLFKSKGFIGTKKTCISVPVGSNIHLTHV